MSDSPKTTIKPRVLIGVHIECEPPSSIGRWCKSIESQAREMESWAREVKEFICDHRSMDEMHLEVIRDYSDLCGVCEEKWEAAYDKDTGKTHCAHCDCELAEEIKAKQEVSQ